MCFYGHNCSHRLAHFLQGFLFLFDLFFCDIICIHSLLDTAVQSLGALSETSLDDSDMNEYLLIYA